MSYFKSFKMTFTAVSATFLCAMSLATSSPAYAQKTTRWDLSIYLGLNSSSTKLLSEFVEEVKEKTNGELDITIRAAGELPYAANEYHNAVGAGEIAMADSAFLTADVPAAGVLTTSFLVQNYDEMRQAMPIVSEQLNKELGRFGAQVLFWNAYPPVRFWGKGDAPESLSDLAGLRIRALSAENAQLLESFGATPVTIATPEIVTALHYGTIDSVMTSAVGIISNQWEELFTWVYSLDVAMTPSYIIVNNGMFADLPEEHQELLRTLGQKYQERMLTLSEQEESENLERLVNAGLTVIEPTEEDKQLAHSYAEPIWEQWTKARGADAQRLITEVRQAMGR